MIICYLLCVTYNIYSTPSMSKRFFHIRKISDTLHNGDRVEKDNTSPHQLKTKHLRGFRCFSITCLTNSVFQSFVSKRCVTRLSVTCATNRIRGAVCCLALINNSLYIVQNKRPEVSSQSLPTRPSTMPSMNCYQNLR